MQKTFCKGRIALYSDRHKLLYSQLYYTSEGMKRIMGAYIRSSPEGGFYIMVRPYDEQIVPKRIYIPVLTGEVKEKIVREKTVNYGIYTRK